MREALILVEVGHWKLFHQYLQDPVASEHLHNLIPELETPK